MGGENPNIDEPVIDNEPDIDYIAAINQMKETTVPKDVYNALKEENRKLLQSLINGEQIDAPETPVDIKELRKELYAGDKELSNLDYCKKTLQLRAALIAKGERDPFLPYGSYVTENAEQHDKAEAVAKVLEECIETSQGDSGIFTAALQRRIKESPIIRRR